jgi:hypothetical protein
VGESKGRSCGRRGLGAGRGREARVAKAERLASRPRRDKEGLGSSLIRVKRIGLVNKGGGRAGAKGLPSQQRFAARTCLFIGMNPSSGNDIRRGAPCPGLDPRQVVGDENQGRHSLLGLLAMLVRIGFVGLQIDPQGGALGAGA